MKAVKAIAALALSVLVCAALLVGYATAVANVRRLRRMHKM
jgi:hypothetical protein